MQPECSYPFRHRYRLTRLGVHFVFVAAFAMIGGALRGFNLLLVLAGLLVGALLIQWRCSRWVISASTISRSLATEAFANVPFRIRFLVANHSRYLPVWMIRIDDPIESTDSAETATAGCGVGIVGPLGSAMTCCDCVVRSRGRYRLGPLSMSTLFPFSLLSARKIVDAQAEFFVYPTLLKLRRGWQQTLATKQGGAAAAARRSGPSEGDYFGLREWQTGDNPKWLHHRATARVGEPIVRQFEQQRQFDACLIVDCYQQSADRSSHEDAVETAISFAATIVVAMDQSPTSRLVLAVADANPRATAGEKNHGGKVKMLQYLSAAKATREPKMVHAIDQAARSAGYAKDLIVISSRDLDDALKAEANSEQLRSRLRAWSRRGGLCWINVLSADFQDWLVDQSGAGVYSHSNIRIHSSDRTQENSDVPVS